MLIVDPEFAALCPPLSREELAALTESIRREGCRDALVVWRGPDGDVLIDGHNRYGICTFDKLPYKTVVAERVRSRDEAFNWIIDNQLARRNLTPDQASYLRGQRYNRSKLAQFSRPSNQSAASNPVAQNEPRDSTAERLAAEHKVSRETIKRDGQFAAAVDTLAETVGPEVKQTILAGDNPISKRDIIAVARAAPTEQARVLAITDKPAILAAARQIKEQQATERRRARESDLTDEERKARESERRWREDGEFGRVIQRLYVVAHSTTAEHAAEVMIEFGLARVFIQSTVDQMEEGAVWLRDCSRALRQHLGTQTPLRKVE